MKIKIDHREHDLIQSCKYFLEISPLYKELQLEICNLPVGDIILCDNNDCEKVLIERKTLSDLAASIKDGRYEEQSFRLNGLSIPNHNIMYMIEGDLNKVQTFKSRIDKSVLYSAIFSLSYYKGFSVLRSQSVEETALMICHMTYKLKKGMSENKDSYYKEEKETNEKETNETNETNEKNYSTVVKRVKKENITINNIGEIMLSQIPGISSTTAIAIIQQFKSLPKLVLSLNENPDCLKDISYCNAKGQTRKINKSAIEHVKLYLQVL